MGCPLFANSNSMSSTIRSQAPCGLLSEGHHFFSEPGPMKDHWPIPNLFANVFTKSAFLKHCCLLSLPSQEMSLNMDMKRILPVKASGVCPLGTQQIIDFVTELQRSEPWENIPLEFRWLSFDVIKIACSSFRLFTPATRSFQAWLHSGHWKSLPIHSTESENTWTLVLWKLMITGSLIKDNCVQVFLWYSILSKQCISSSLLIVAAEISNICFNVDFSPFCTTFRIVEQLFPMNVAAFNVVAMNIPHIIECSVQSSALLDILFCRIRTWFFTLLINSVVSLPTMNFSKSAFSGYPLNRVSPFFHERILRWIWRWTFPTLIDIVTEIAIVSCHTLPVGFPIANNLQEFFVHAVLFPDSSWPRRSSQNFRFWPKNSYFEFPARHFFSPQLAICDNQVLTSSDESPGRTIPIRSWVYQTLVFLICTIVSKMSSGWIFVIDNFVPSHFESNSWISPFRTAMVNRSV